MLNLVNISHTYSNDYHSEKVLNNINLQIEKEKIYCILGPSGSGKTTLLNIMGGLLTPTEGKVFFDSEEITKYTEKRLAELRLKKIGFIFQNYNLIPFLTVKDNILLQLKLAKQDIEKFIDYYENLVNILGIKDKEYKYINQLSGGEQQRVAIARCMIMKPKIILADEPTGNLDTKNTEIFIQLVQSVLKNADSTFVIITHNEKLCKYCDRIIRIEDGKVNQSDH